MQTFFFFLRTFNYGCFHSVHVHFTSACKHIQLDIFVMLKAYIMERNYDPKIWFYAHFMSGFFFFFFLEARNFSVQTQSRESEVVRHGMSDMLFTPSHCVYSHVRAVRVSPGLWWYLLFGMDVSLKSIRMYSYTVYVFESWAVRAAVFRLWSLGLR